MYELCYFYSPRFVVVVLVIVHYLPGKLKCYLICFAVSCLIIFAYIIPSIQFPTAFLLSSFTCKNKTPLEFDVRSK